METQPPSPGIWAHRDGDPDLKTSVQGPLIPLSVDPEVLTAGSFSCPHCCAKGSGAE